METVGKVAGTRGRPSRIAVPRNISEQSGINGYVFAPEFRELAGARSLKISKSVAEGRSAFEHSTLAASLATDGGGPTVGHNWIKIWINGKHRAAGSNAKRIWLCFGPTKRVELRGPFRKGHWIMWDFTEAAWLLRGIPTDAWDELALVTESRDGILIDRVVVRHSSVTILDWTCNAWLDGSKLEPHGKLSFTAKILSKKLSQIGNRWTPQLHWAARELGKTHGGKYGSRGAWCSEFASWCLRKALWDTPSGDIDSGHMEQYFAKRNRRYTRSDLLAKKYKLSEGDYVRLQWSNGGQHSVLFIRYLDDGDRPTENTRFQTIEGNVGATVKVTTRRLRDVLAMGNAR